MLAKWRADEGLISARRLITESEGQDLTLEDLCAAAQVSHLALLLHREVRDRIAQQGLKAGAPYRPTSGALNVDANAIKIKVRILFMTVEDYPHKCFPL